MLQATRNEWRFSVQKTAINAETAERAELLFLCEFRVFCVVRRLVNG